MRLWYLSCDRITVRVATDRHDRITWAAPVVRRFVGQPLSDLEHWFQTIGGFRKQEIFDPRHKGHHLTASTRDATKNGG